MRGYTTVGAGANKAQKILAILKNKIWMRHPKTFKLLRVQYRLIKVLSSEFPVGYPGRHIPEETRRRQRPKRWDDNKCEKYKSEYKN